MIGCSWNNSCRFLLFWRMFQFLQTTDVRFGKNRLYVNINGMHFESCCSWSFSCSRLSLISSSTFPNWSSTSSVRNLASKIYLSVLLTNGQNLSWLRKFSLFEVLGYMECCFKDFGCSELMLRKVWQSLFFLNILVCNLYISNIFRYPEMIL